MRRQHLAEVARAICSFSRPRALSSHARTSEDRSSSDTASKAALADIQSRHSVHNIGRIAIVIAVLGLPVMAAQSGRDTRTWYQVYQEGVRQIQRQQWEQAIQSMLAAKKQGPAPGRRINFYGDVFEDFLPDYYLGVAYANRAQYKEAASAFETVRQSQLVATRDKEYAEMQRLSAVVTAALTKAAEPVTTTANNAKPTTTPPAQKDDKSDIQGPPLPQPQSQQQAGNAEASPPRPEARPEETKVAVNNPPPALPTDTRKAPAPTARPTNAPSTRRPSQTPAIDEARAMAAFFDGDYRRALDLLSVETADKRTPRAEFYLACSRAALVLTTGSGASIEEARQGFAKIDAAQFAADARYISPRILQLLRAPNR